MNKASPISLLVLPRATSSMISISRPVIPAGERLADARARGLSPQLAERLGAGTTQAACAEPVRGVYAACSHSRARASRAVVSQVDAAVYDYVDTLRARGISWTRIGEALGVSKQAAWERFSGED